MSIFRNLPKSRTSRPNRSLGVENMEQRLMFTMPAVSAEAAIVATGDGEIVGEHNADQQRHMASTTKIMTALLAIEKSADGNPYGLSLDDQVEVGWYAGNVNVGGFGNGRFDPGDVASLKDLVFATMLHSDNEAAHAVAEHVSIHQPDSGYSEVSNNLVDGSGLVSEFADLMNERAAELGMSDTSFRTPDGAQYLYESISLISSHYTTARDMATLAKAAMANPVFKEIVSTSQTQITVNGLSETVRNGNGLIRSSSDQYPGAEGVKTGFTPVAAHCLVSQATILGKTMTVVVLGAETSDDLYDDTHALLNHGFEDAYQFIVDVDQREVETSLATYDFDAKLLTITGTDGDDDLSLTQSNGLLRVELNGESEEFPVDDLDSVVVDMQGGDDQVTTSGSISGYELEIEGDGGYDTLDVESPMILAAITGDESGTFANAFNGVASISFDDFEHLNPDDHRDEANLAQRISMIRGCMCDHEIEKGGFIHSADDQDWFRFEAGTGSIVMSLDSVGETTSDATLELWNLTDPDNPTPMGAVDADAAAESVDIDSGQYGFRVGDGQKFSQYQITATVPSAPLKWRDFVDLPTRPKERWETMPTRGFDKPGIGPDPTPMKAIDRVGPRIQQPTDTRPTSQDSRRVFERYTAPTRQTVAVTSPRAVDQVLATEIRGDEREATAHRVGMTWLPF